MKIFLALLVVLYSFNHGIAQEIKQIKKKLLPGLTEIYHVLENDRKLKHGPYFMISDGDTITKGYYINNKKTGIWKFYLHEEMRLEYSYSYDSNKVLSDIPGKSRKALYSEGHEYFEYLKVSNTKYPPEAIDSEHYGSVTISFTVRANGTVSDFTIYVGCGHLLLNNEALRVIKKVASENYWFPAINSNGEKIDSTVYKSVIFNL